MGRAFLRPSHNLSYSSVNGYDKKARPILQGSVPSLDLSHL